MKRERFHTIGCLLLVLALLACGCSAAAVKTDLPAATPQVIVTVTQLPLSAETVSMEAAVAEPSFELLQTELLPAPAPKPTDEPFSIVWFSDTQYYSQD